MVSGTCERHRKKYFASLFGKAEEHSSKYAILFKVQRSFSVMSAWYVVRQYAEPQRQQCTEVCVFIGAFLAWRDGDKKMCSMSGLKSCRGRESRGRGLEAGGRCPFHTVVREAF